jgi:hypothetical protein
MTFETRRGKDEVPAEGRRTEAPSRADLGDGLTLLACATDGLKALEERLRLLEDALSSGEALALPETRQPISERATPPHIELIVRAHEIGARIRRMNLRLGAVERALDGLAPLGLDDVMPLRGTRRPDAYKRPASAPVRGDRPAARPRLVDPDGTWPTAS